MVKLKVALIVASMTVVMAQGDGIPGWMRGVFLTYWSAGWVFVGWDAERSGRRTLWDYAESPMPAS